MESGSEKDPSLDLGEDFVLHNITHGLGNLFGHASAAPIDLVQLKKAKKGRLHLSLSCPEHFAPRLRASLTLQGRYQGHPCVYVVHQVDKKALDVQLLSEEENKDKKPLRYF